MAYESHVLTLLNKFSTKNWECLASHADVLRGSSRVPRGAGTHDEPLRTSAWEARECLVNGKTLRERYSNVRPVIVLQLPDNFNRPSTVGEDKSESIAPFYLFLISQKKKKECRRILWPCWPRGTTMLKSSIMRVRKITWVPFLPLMDSLYCF